MPFSGKFIYQFGVCFNWFLICTNYFGCFSPQDWIFKQLCQCSTPLHPLIPPLIEVYVNSIIVPSARTDRTNDPITEEEILSVFKDSIILCYSRKDASKDVEPMDTSGEKSTDCRSDFTSQILLLYYVLLYHDTLQNNMKSIGMQWKLQNLALEF